MKRAQLLVFFLILPSIGMFCNYFPLDEKACIQKTIGISCEFNQFWNSCIESSSTALGCSPNLNKIACLRQKTTMNGSEARCYFGTKCIKANKFHLRKLKCEDNFSIFACLNLEVQHCQWMNNQCITFEGSIILQDTCSQVYNQPVSPHLCSQIPDLKCQNNGFLEGYTCSDVTDVSLKELTCDALGINKMACLSIQTPGKKCLFQNNYCQSYQNQVIVSCEEFLNRELCLSLIDPILTCQWTARGCSTVLSQKTLICGDLNNVSPSVCSQASGACYYEEENKKCYEVTDLTIIHCDTKGLNKRACFGVQSEKCVYISEQCRTVSDEELHLFGCEQNFNKLACINVTTPYQFCQWNGQFCSRIIINQESNCPLDQDVDNPIQVNGNTCRAISKQNQGCKYNFFTSLCEVSMSTDSCTVSYLNLYGCVQSQSNMACRWNTDRYECEEAKIIEQLTKCQDLGFANPLACSQISEPLVTISNKKIAIGCYYNQETQSCNQTNDIVLKQMECAQLGLNKYGCTQIIKVGQRCRWIRGSCTSIARRESIASILCLDLQFVNAGTCALASANQEVCKYSIDAFGCVNAINSSKDGDYCDSPGLNSYGCSQITRNLQGCYFDKINNLCILAPDKTSVNETVQQASTQLLSTAKCVASSPTLNICIAIETLGEFCSWSNRSNSCGYQFVSFNEKCLDYNTAEKLKTVAGASINVNANVCASIVMSFPDYDPKAVLTTTDALRGYCQFDGKGNCVIYQYKPCSDNCCTTVSGINAHVCSRYTNRGVFCYFNEYNKCVELTNDNTDIGSIQSVKAYFNYKQYKCSSMSFRSCTMIDWSIKQQCFWNGNACIQINYNDYKNFAVFQGTSLSRYGCLGIQANKSNTVKYFNYYKESNTCQINPDPQLTSCTQFEVNMNKCLGLTPNNYCYWDKLSMLCKPIDDYLTFKTCDEFQNKKACIENPYNPCLFLDSADKCISSPKDVDCNDFSNPANDYFGKVNEKACANITKPGQICKFLTNLCIVAGDISANCQLPGLNSIGCYAKTSGNCRWDEDKLLCYEADDQTIPSLKCTDNVNKELCLQIISQPCEWVLLDMICITKTSLISVSSSNKYNPQACTQLTGAAYYYDQATSTCKILSSDDNDCTSQIMNLQACLLNTKGYRCYFDSNQLPENKCSYFKKEQEICSSTLQINMQICMDIPSLCYFDESDLNCKDAKLSVSMKCSSLASSVLHYNKLSCSSISDKITDSSTDASLKVCTSSSSGASPSAQQCYFEKYCFWSETLYGCQLSRILDESYSAGSSGSQNQNSVPATCSLSQRTFQCQPIYSKAICLQFGDNCFFDISQGGCKPYINNSFKVTDCSQINGTKCTSSKTVNAYCLEKPLGDGEDLTTDCTLDPSITSKCEIDSGVVKSSCSSLSSSSIEFDCSQATDDCYLNSSCVAPANTDGLDCSTPGVSKTLCLQFDPPCDFSSGKCTTLTIPALDSDGYNYYYVCNEVNLLITKNPNVACGSVITSPCKYQNSTCLNAFYTTCSSLDGLIVSQLACNQCEGKTAAYDPDTYSCVIITDLVTSCDSITDLTTCQTKAKQCFWNSEGGLCQINLARLNSLSCLQLTTSSLAKWDQNTNQCIALSKADALDETSCSIQSIKSCLLINNSCWVSATTNQCEESKQIDKSCQEINIAKGLQNQCLLSSLAACKWVNNECISANLAVDNCSVLNKYGCLTIDKVTCGWSDKDSKCKQVYLQTNSGCTKYTNDQYYRQVNPYSCSSLLQGNCYWNSYLHQCVSVGNSAIISCLTHSGINQTACIQHTIGKCKYDTVAKKCTPITDQDTSCSDKMNQEACLSLNFCQFAQNICLNYPYAANTSIILASKIPINNAAISPYICTYYNDHINNSFFIYDEGRGYCINADKASPSQFIATCSSTGINEKICKQKTKDYCQFTNSQCTALTLNMINQEQSCNNTYNWQSCIKLPLNCKFSSGECMQVLETDTCATLSQGTVFVSSKVCAQMKQACSYNTVSYNCQLIPNAPQLCSTVGISQIGCLSYTSTSFCCFDSQNYLCSDNYDRSLSCNDSKTPKTWYINANLCNFINSIGNYCKFMDGECSQLTEIQVSYCYVATPTNSRTCSKAQNTLCFYNPDSNYCSPDYNLLQLQKWYNSNSFNKQACIRFASTTDIRKTIWDDIQGCIELSIKDLQNIQCNSPVNQYGCVSISNPTQFCQFNISTFKCVGFDYTIPPEIPIGTCATLTNVSRFEFCQYASDTCSYNSQSKNCVSAPITNSQIINSNDCFDKGMSQSLCITLTKCKYSTVRKMCYGGNIYCSDNTSQTCGLVKAEPCWIQNDSCVGVSYNDLTTANCEDVVNLVGCTSIANPSIACQFDLSNKLCKELTSFNNNCATYLNINSSKVCEQTTDAPCKFDFKLKGCKEVQTSEVLECDRGLNQLACTKNTRSSLKCKFGKFCFGPTFGISQCSDISNKDTCLNYSLQCQWDNSNQLCTDYSVNGQQCQDLEANNIIVSSQVCYKSKVNGGACVYNTNTYTCKLINPQACQELETLEQCIQLQSLPCLWANDRCNFVTVINTDLCSSIGQNGSQRACMDVFRQGELCYYNNNQCQAFTEYIKGQQTNCLDTINLIACVQQQYNQCQWKVTTSEVMVTLKDKIQYQSGVCSEYQADPLQNCDETLSFLSCFTITKKGQFCQWLNGQCTQIPQQISTVDIYFNTYELINSNSCGLVNVGRVKYQELTRSCVLISEEDILTCKCGSETVGLNKYACLSITSESCIWIDIQKRCVEYQSKCQSQTNNRLLGVQNDSCFLQNVSEQVCQRLEQPCGYYENTCVKVDLSLISCKDSRINRYACENMILQQCLWDIENNQCKLQTGNLKIHLSEDQNNILYSQIFGLLMFVIVIASQF